MDQMILNYALYILIVLTWVLKSSQVLWEIFQLLYVAEYIFPGCPGVSSGRLSYNIPRNRGRLNFRPQQRSLSSKFCCYMVIETKYFSRKKLQKILQKLRSARTAVKIESIIGIVANGMMSLVNIRQCIILGYISFYLVKIQPNLRISLVSRYL